MTKHNVQIFGVRPFFKSSTNQHLAVKLWKMRCRTPKQHNILTSWHNHLKANKWPASHFLPVVDSCNLVFYAQSTSVSGQVVDRYQARSFHFTMPYFVLLTDTRPSHHAWLCLVDRYQAKSFYFIMPDFVLLTDTRPSPSISSCLCLVDRYWAKSSCLTVSCWQIPGQVLPLHHAWLCLVDRYLAKSFHFIMPYFPTGTMERIDNEGQIATAKVLMQFFSAVVFHTFSLVWLTLASEWRHTNTAVFVAVSFMWHLFSAD